MPNPPLNVIAREMIAEGPEYPGPSLCNDFQLCTPILPWANLAAAASGPLYRRHGGLYDMRVGAADAPELHTL